MPFAASRTTCDIVATATIWQNRKNAIFAATLAASDAAYQKALEQHGRGDFEGSIRALRAGIAELELLPGGAEVHARWQRAMLRLARSEQAVGRRGEAQAVLQRLLTIEPALEVDPRLYPQRDDLTPEQEFYGFIQQFPDIYAQLQRAHAVRDWVRIDRLQYSAHHIVADRFALLTHAAGFIAPLYSKGLFGSPATTYLLAVLLHKAK